MATVADMLVSIGADISEFKKAMKDMQTSLKDAGDKMRGMGEQMTAGITAPLAGVGLVAMKSASDMEKSAKTMQAQLGVTESQAKELGDAANELWQDAFGDSVDEAAQAVATVKTNMQDLAQTKDEVKGLTEQAFILRDAFGAEINESTRTAAVMMRQFGIGGSEAMDLITVGMQKGGNFSDELLDTLREYAPQFKAAGMSAKDMLGVLLQGTEAGAFNLDKVGDAVKEFNIRMKDGSDTSAEALTALGYNADEMGKKFAAGGDDAKKAFMAITGQLAAMEDEQKAAQLGVALFGTQWEDLEASVVTSMQKGIGSIEDVEGATQQAGEALYDTFGTRLTSFVRDLQASLAPLGMVLLDMAEQILPPISAALGKMAEWFEGLSPTIQKVIVVVGIIVAALGPLLIVAGMIAQAIAALIPVFTAVGGAIAAASVPIWPIIAAIAALVAVGVLLYQNWEVVKAKAIEVWGAIMEFIQPAVDAVTAFIMSKFNAVKDWWLELWPTLSQAFTNIWNGIKAFIEPIINAIVAVFKWAWPFIETLIKQVWENIKGVIDGALNIIMGVIEAFANLFTGNWQGLWDSVKKIISGALELIWNWVQLFGIGKLLKFFTGLVGKLLKPIKSMWSKIKYEFEFKLMQIWDIVKGKFDKILNFFGGLKDTFYNAGKGLLEMMGKGIKNAASAVIDKVKGIAQKVRNLLPFSPAKEGPLSDLDKLDFAGPITDSIKFGLPKIKDAMAGALQMPDINPGKTEFAGDNKEEKIVNFERLFDGANITVNDETDIKHIAKEIYNLTKTRGRGLGVRV